MTSQIKSTIHGQFASWEVNQDQQNLCQVQHLFWKGTSLSFQAICGCSAVLWDFIMTIIGHIGLVQLRRINSIISSHLEGRETSLELPFSSDWIEKESGEPCLPLNVLTDKSR